RGVVILLGPVVLLLGVPGAAAIQVIAGHLGLQADRLVVVLDGSGQIVLIGVDRSPIIERGGVLRVEVYRGAVVGDRLRVILLGVPGVAAVDEIDGRLRIEPDGLAVIGDGVFP